MAADVRIQAQRSESGRPVRQSSQVDRVAWYLAGLGLPLGHTVISQLILLGSYLTRSIRQRRSQSASLFHRDRAIQRSGVRQRLRRFWAAVLTQPLSGLALWMVFTSLFAHNIANAMGSSVLSILVGWIVLSNMGRIFSDQASVRRGLAKVTVSGIGLGALYTLAAFVPDKLREPHAFIRGELPFVGCNTAGLIFAAGAIFILGLLPYVSRREKVVLAFVFALAFAALIATQSRGALLAFIAGLIVLALLSPKLAWLLIPIGALLVAAIVASPMVTKRYASIFQLAANEDRIELWRYSVQMIRDHPLLGIGMNNFRAAFAEYSGKSVSMPFSHNIILEMALSTGIPGVLLFLRACLQPMVNGIRSIVSERDSGQSRVALAILIVVLVHLQVDIPIFSADMLPVFLIPYAVLDRFGVEVRVGEARVDEARADEVGVDDARADDVGVGQQGYNEQSARG